MRALVLAVAALALAACGSTTQNAAPSSAAPTPDPLNVAACRTFDKSADRLSQLKDYLGTGKGNGSMLISLSAKFSLETMQGAARLAHGDVQQVMDRAVAAVEIVQSEAANSPDGMVDMVNETQAARLAIQQVGQACKRVGVDLAASL